MLALAALAASVAATSASQSALELQTAAGAVKIEPWGANALRVRAVL